MALAQDVINEIQKQVGSVSGIKAAPNYPPEDMSAFPFAVAYEGPGSWEWYTSGGTYGSKKGLLTVIVEVHLARIDLPADAEKAAFYSDAIPNVILKGVRSDRLNSTITAMGKIESSGLIAMSWGSEQKNTLGFRFTVTGINIKSDIT
jgi:hypothetical protein